MSTVTYRYKRLENLEVPIITTLRSKSASIALRLRWAFLTSLESGSTCLDEQESSAISRPTTALILFKKKTANYC